MKPPQVFQNRVFPSYLRRLKQVSPLNSQRKAPERIKLGSSQDEHHESYFESLPGFQ